MLKSGESDQVVQLISQLYVDQMSLLLLQVVELIAFHPQVHWCGLCLILYKQDGPKVMLFLEYVKVDKYKIQYLITTLSKIYGCCCVLLTWVQTIFLPNIVSIG